MNRRNWLIQSTIALTGASLLPLSAFTTSDTAVDDAIQTEGPITLCCNENPYGPSLAAKKAMIQMIGKSNRYQWNTIGQLTKAIAIKNNVKDETVLLGAGSTELLDLCVQLATAKQGSVVAPDPSFTRWATIAEQAGMKKVLVPLTADKKIDLPAMLAAIQPDTRMVYICNPNNPTGTICDDVALARFVDAATKKTTVVIDEAYLEYANGTSLCKIAMDNRNLVVVKTFSKIYGLAGARIGYAVAHKDTVQRLSDLRCAFSISVSATSMAAALASLEDTAFVKSTYERNEAVKQYTVKEMERLNIRCIPSSTNFIYFSLASYKKDFFEQISKHQISATEIFEEDGKWSRITIGTMNEMKRVIAAIS